MVATLPDENCTDPPIREHFVEHGVDCMDQKLHTVAEAEATALTVVNGISRDSEEANGDDSSSDDDDPIGPSGGLFCATLI
eukprot:3776855-Ditylum_brightwellii.AAC.1